jgi:hypothetical protein
MVYLFGVQVKEFNQLADLAFFEFRLSVKLVVKSLFRNPKRRRDSAVGFLLPRNFGPKFCPIQSSTPS